jgi:histidyl-tRNA synthetase
MPDLRLAMDCTAGGFKAQLRRADRSGARLALIIGEDELDSGSVSVKPLRSNVAQKIVKLEELAEALLREAAQ